MPKGYKTSIFVSSTCYDLAQIRADLRDFAESVGLEPVLSEFDSFPVNPNQTTVENCLEAVKSRADIFVLVIGGRYGSINETGKSITNLEFAEASAKGIPKYVFVLDRVLALLPVWKDNPEANFGSVIDSPKLLQFIYDLKNSGETWVYPFTHAQDIVRILREQLSYLFAECLDVRAKLQDSNTDVSRMGPKALKLFIEKPKGWEWLLFAQVLADRIDEYRYKRLDVELGISFGASIILDDDVAPVASWISEKFSLASNAASQLSNVLNGFEKAVGPPGVPADVTRLMHLASRMGDGYEQMLDWTLEFSRVVVDEKYKRLLFLAANFSSNAIKEIEEFCIGLYGTFEKYIANIDSYKPGTVVNITLKLTAPDQDDFNRELRTFRRR